MDVDGVMKKKNEAVREKEDIIYFILSFKERDFVGEYK